MKVDEAMQIITENWLFVTKHELDDNNKQFKQAIETLLNEYKTLKRDFSYIDQEEHRLDMRNNELLIENKKLKEELDDKQNEIKWCREQMDGMSGQAKQIQEDYQKYIREYYE